ncbi:MAG: glucose-1-phosphate adenylyltransferase [Clostridia bacterium]
MRIERRDEAVIAQKKECMAMLLAGGQGSRLYLLTKNMAKPAVPFGGKYRIIDFPLSNCINSGIDTVGVLTQYKPMELNAYIGSGQPWDLDRLNGGVFILPPYVSEKAGEWYKGTANAIYQNQTFIGQYDPDHVLILSGDHIYKMDYSRMLAFHKEKGADCTIAVIDVPLEEASRFGIMELAPDDSITAFQEKPREPKSTKASMGIYIFKWDVLRQYLEKDEKDPGSSNDFGKDVIPGMLLDGRRMFGYSYNGYWKDVGTIESLWQSNMDILDESSSLNLSDSDWKIYSRNFVLPPHYIGYHGKVRNSIVTEGCTIDGEVISSVIFRCVEIEEGALVQDSVIMPGAWIKKGAVVKSSIVAEDAVIEENATVGCNMGHYGKHGPCGIAVIGKGVTIGKGQIVKPDEMIEHDRKSP